MFHRSRRDALFDGVGEPVTRITRRLVAIDTEVQMRTVCSTGLPDASDQFAGFYLLPFGDVQFLQMDVKGNDALSMVDSNAVAVKLESSSSQDHNARSACHYRRPQSACKVQAGVKIVLEKFAVDCAAHPKRR